MRSGFTAVAAVVAVLAASGCSRTVQVESGGDVGAVTPVSARTLPEGAMVQVALDQTIGVQRSHVGDRFTAHVTNAVVAQNGATAVPAGATVTGTVTGLKGASGNDPALIRLDFQSLSFGGSSYPFEASVQRTAVPGADNQQVLRGAAIGAAAGAVLGAVLGDADLKHILVGGALGAAAGTVISLGIQSQNAELPKGTTMTLRTTQTVALGY